MSYFGNNKLFNITSKGDSCFIRYSAYADGTNFTKTWSAGQNYIGIATAQLAPTDKSGYVWSAITKGDKGDKGNPGNDGKSVTNVEINDEGELVITLSDNTVFNLGVVVGGKGDPGEKGEKGDPYTLTDGDKAEITEEVVSHITDSKGNLLIPMSPIKYSTTVAGGGFIEKEYFRLKVGQEYRVVYSDEPTTDEFSIRVGLRMGNGGIGASIIEKHSNIPDEGTNYFTIKLLEVKDLIVSYEWNGVLRTHDFSSLFGQELFDEICSFEIHDWQGEVYRPIVDGKDGIDGKSAYEIAVDNGFEGTEAEWIARLDPNNIADLVLNSLERAEDWVL